MEVSKIPVRHSFRQAKASMTEVNKNQYGNAAINQTNPKEEIKTEASIDRNGEVRYDISYEDGLERTLQTPAMQQFMKRRGISYDGESFEFGEPQELEEGEAEPIIESVELPDDIASLVEHFGDDFDSLADRLTDGSITAKIKRTDLQGRIITAAPQPQPVPQPRRVLSSVSTPPRQSTASNGRLAAFCANCGFGFKESERFCPSCGSQRMAL